MIISNPEAAMLSVSRIGLASKSQVERDLWAS